MEWNKDFIFHKQEFIIKPIEKKSDLYVLNVHFCWLNSVNVMLDLPSCFIDIKFTKCAFKKN